MRGFAIPHACPAEIDALSTAVTPEGRWLVLSAGGGTARCWPADLDGPLGPPLRRQPGLFLATSLALVPGGDIVVGRCLSELGRWDRSTGEAAGADRMVRFWDPLTWTEFAEPVACGKRVMMLSVVQPAGERPVVCALGADAAVHRYDLLAGEMTGPPVRTGWQPRPAWPAFPRIHGRYSDAGPRHHRDLLRLPVGAAVGPADR